MNLETFLGFSPVLSFSPSSGDTISTCILDGTVGRVPHISLGSEKKRNGSENEWSEIVKKGLVSLVSL